MYVGSYIIDPFSPYWVGYFQKGMASLLPEWLITLGFCFFISESSIFIHNRLNRVLPWTGHSGRRFALETTINLLIVLISHLVINLLFPYCVDSQESSVLNSPIEETRGTIQWIVVSIMIAFMIMGLNIGNYLITNWKNDLIRVSELNQVAIEAELQSLKLQIDPHFVFNNLSVLSEIILEDQQLGYNYAENFSRIYRYMLVNSKKNIITLDEELKFLDSYRFLIKHRFGEGIQFAINVANESRQLCMPPLTLQLLVENALKHNKTSKKEPLQVSIYTNDKMELIVENALLPIEKPLDSSGIGLKNIVRRYNLLSEKEPQIMVDKTRFKVVIPLIKL
jgi:LytS/YehU family sensor histidine kinase